MMDFGEDGEEWKRLFSDYQMHLVCLNEMEDFSTYQSPLKELFALIAAKGDRKKLKKLILGDPVYQNMDEETANIANVMIGGKRIVAKKEEYQDDYDMCDGLKGIIEDRTGNRFAKGYKGDKSVKSRKYHIFRLFCVAFS